MTNAEKYAEQIAKVLAKDSSSIMCESFCGILSPGGESYDCYKCLLKGKRCSDLEAVNRWLLQETDE